MNDTKKQSLGIVIGLMIVAAVMALIRYRQRSRPPHHPTTAILDWNSYSSNGFWVG